MFATKYIKKTALAAMAVAVMAVSASQANATRQGAHAPALERGSPHMKLFGRTLPPIGYVDFCRTRKKECQTPSGEAVRVVMSDARWQDLRRVTTRINEKIEPVSDQDLYNVIEYWTYPTTRGDCEDYVLLKKRELIALGWPPSTLLITVLRDENGDGHAVLTVTTDQGDYILDNRTDEVLFWRDTGYSYIKRQSQEHPSVWVSLKPRNTRSSQAVLPGMPGQ